MVQDAIELLPTMAFLAYRFLPAAVIVAVIFWRPLRRLPAEGWRAGLLMGAFLTGGYVFQTLGLEQTTVSNTGFITGLFVVLTPVLGAILLGQRISTVGWIAAGAAMLGLWLLSGASDSFDLRGDGLVLVCAFSLAAHILATASAVKRFDVGALLAIQLGVVGITCLVIGALAGQLEKPSGTTVWSALLVTSLVASALGFFVQSFAQRHAPPARTALILASEPAFAGFFGWLLNNERLAATGLAGAALIMVAIVSVEIAPRLRPPRPLPEG
ncbi:MAG: DMT family transporter [Actinomycetota bacterium]|nr:DMT family transporter [Actinomycetota bacterium]